MMSISSQSSWVAQVTRKLLLNIRIWVYLNQIPLKFGLRSSLLFLTASLFAFLPFMHNIPLGPSRDDLVWVYSTAVVVGGAAMTSGSGVARVLDRCAGTISGCILGTAVVELSDFMGHKGPYFVAACICTYGFVVCFYMAKYPSVVGTHTYAYVLSLRTFGLVVLSTFWIEDEGRWRIGAWRTGMIVIGSVISVVCVMFLLPVRTVESAHNKCVRVIEIEARLVRDILHKRTRGIESPDPEPDRKLGELDSIHRSYKAAMQGIVQIRNTLDFASLEKPGSVITKRLGTHYADAAYYLFMARKLRRLATHAIAMEEQINIKPSPPLPTSERAELYIELSEVLQSTLMLVAKQMARVPKCVQQKLETETDEILIKPDYVEGTNWIANPLPRGKSMQCSATCVHEYGLQDSQLRLKAQSIRKTILRLSCTPPPFRGAHTKDASLPQHSSIPTRRRSYSGVVQCPTLNPTHIPEILSQHEYTEVDTMAWAQGDPVIMKACQAHASELYNGMVVHLGLIVLKILKHAARLAPTTCTCSSLQQGDSIQCKHTTSATTPSGK